ncbi:Crp/Fnr family transcriptional regulator [Pseudomaricurvus alkylphenolicus]|uniref:Crp/Fnr family transcriptional regulator n=1 Tax=Pseudomaricurvus alkylphenolicus TaxID=1306991 RepID=UPI00141F9730|nr:Crp/Fnr family transcriptional regulator [Pseudomaricurvus alkylphenolicus]NIB43476.1 Crp/Fnr family transcriptional regulator [Pseudomaricurvus alkylphenolicus]
MNKRQYCLDRMYRVVRDQVGFTSADWRLFAPFLNIREVDSRHILQATGESANNHHFVVRGLVRFFYITQEGKELNKGFYGEDYIVGSLSSVILNEPSRFSIATLEPCTLVELRLDQLQKLQGRCASWDRLFEYCCQMMLVRNERREAELLTLSAKERFQRFVHNFPGYIQRIPQYHIATYLGITPEALSRFKKQWLSEDRGN